MFDFATTGSPEPAPQAEYAAAVAREFPHLTGQVYPSYVHLFARVVSEVGRLDMELHLERWRVHDRGRVARIAVQSIHKRTQTRVVYLAWDWLEAIALGERFDFRDRLAELQGEFRASVYGGPTTYALIRAAYEKGIPTFYLWNEGLVQYGHGRRQVRGSATTFTPDSQLDSDFTTGKDDCKRFLEELGLPVPKGGVAADAEEAKALADECGYPVAVKPLVGHKGIGVTAGVAGPEELSEAFARAAGAVPEGGRVEVIVETSLHGSDYRMLCVDGRFVAATERRRPWVTGDGASTVDELIERENATPARLDTPTSPLSKIPRDEAMLSHLREQGLELDSVPEAGRTVHLRKVANLSAGGVSIDVTDSVHPDNVVMAQDVAAQLGLTCLGIDVVAESLARSWREGNFGIIEINAAPGVYMYARPAVGAGVDVPSRILGTFFASGAAARIPIIVFNAINPEELKEIVDHVLARHPDWTVGGVCRRCVVVNRGEKPMHRDHNTNVLNLLRHPRLDLLIAEYDGNTFERDGMLTVGHDMVVLDRPTATEENLARDLREDGTLVRLSERNVLIRRRGLIEEYALGGSEPFSRVYLKEIATILGAGA